MIYVHVPFCKGFCVYCDFYSELCPDATALRRFGAELCAEARRRADEIAAASAVPTLYFGGGTPSLLPLPVLGDIVAALGNGPWEEFTVEVNPEDIVQRGAAYVQGLRALGVNRVSMGVQSLSDEILHWMGRRHNAERARRAFRLLREGGFDNLSVDVIFGVPGLSLQTLQETVEELLAWAPEHLSCYQLSIEEGSALAAMLREGRCAEAPEEDCRAQYDWLCARLRTAGYRHYEISNWALPGRESRHNSAYWKRVPYVGLGPGAHSFRILPDGTQMRSWNREQRSGWTAESETLSPEEIREETLMLGLRTAEGLPDGRRIAERDWFIADALIAGML
ncbi:MAG: coproporphyrinogen III oxidase family protein [Bacteroidales bacterium]|nr:coproporphyrinogen III oxidase family protein [Bacteroidales bacterium]